MFHRIQNAARILAALIVCGLPAAAQVTVGQNSELASGGSLSVGYSGRSGNNDPPSHSLDLSGNGWLRGFYYKPQFVSFEFQPYYRRAQNDSIYQTITNGSGFHATSNIFSGSKFPGYLTFGKTYENTGQFGIPGITGIASHGNGTNFGVGWSALLPGLPTLSAIYSTSSGDSTVFGANTDSNSSSNNLTLQSTYRLAGFDLTGQYVHLSTESAFPVFFEGGETQESHTASNSFMFNAGHKLPMAGHWNMVWTRSSYNGEYQSGTSGGMNNGVVHNLNTLTSFNPAPRLNLSFGGNYNDNAFGALQQRILEAGGAPLPIVNTSLHTLSVNGVAGYTVFSHLAVYARANHYERWLHGDRRGLTQFGGNATFNYAKSFLGSMTFSLGVIDTYTQQGNSAASLVGSMNYLRRFQSWELGANFSYSQQVQTLFDVYTTSNYRYGANVKRRFGGLQWVGAFNGSQSGLTHFEGYKSRSEGYSTSLLFYRFTLNGQYTTSAGTSILTSTGLIDIPPGVPAPLLHLPVLYDARSYGGGVSYRPFRRATISANYNKARSSTAGPTLTTGFHSTIFNARFQYRLRKLDVDANFTQFEQSIRTGALPTTINSYYIRFSRWFNLF